MGESKQPQDCNENTAQPQPRQIKQEDTSFSTICMNWSFKTYCKFNKNFIKLLADDKTDDA